MNGRTNSTDSRTVDIEIPLDCPSNFNGEADNAQVRLTWNDPPNKYATNINDTADESNQIVSEWSKTRIVRKIDSDPIHEDDGEIVVESIIKNQYSSSAYIDAGLINDKEYHYAAYAINSENVASMPSIDIVVPKAGWPVSQLKVGTVVKMNVNKNPCEFIVINQGNPNPERYDSSCDGTWLLMKNIYANHVWNDPNNNDYKNSMIHNYLNTTVIDLFDENIKLAIKQVKIPYRPGYGTSTGVSIGTNGLSCKVFLLSAREVGATSDRYNTWDNLLDGDKLSYFPSWDIDHGTSLVVATLNGVRGNWWLRSPSCQLGGSPFAGLILSSGQGESYVTSSNNVGVRPAIVLYNNILYDADMNIIA